MYLETLGLLETSFMTTIRSIRSVNDIDVGDEYLRDAQTTLQRYEKRGFSYVEFGGYCN